MGVRTDHVATALIGNAVGAKVGTASSPTSSAGTFEDTLSLNTALGYNPVEGWMTCDGPGTLRIVISPDGTNYHPTTDGSTGTVIEIKSGETLDFEKFDISLHTVKVDADADNTLYRFLFY